MGLTFSTPNGGNSASTGQKNKNNNASANAQTANYGSGNTKTPTYASPNEQGQNKAAPVATPSYDPRGEDNPYGNYQPKTPPPSTPPPSNDGGNGNNPPPITTPAPPSVITNDSLDAWLESLEDGFNLKDGLTKRSIEDNTNLINDNINTINTNQQSSDDMFSTQEDDLSSLFFEQRTQGNQLESTNQDVDNVVADLGETDSTVGAVQSDLSDQQQELLQLDASAKKLGLSLVDTQGVQVDIQRDIIDNQTRMQQGQTSDAKARTSLDNQVNKAVDSVGVRLDDANEDFNQFSFDTNDSFNLVVDGQQILGDQLVESGFKMDNIYNTLGSEIDDNTNTIDTNQADTVQNLNKAASTAETAREELRSAIMAATDNRITTISDYAIEVERGAIVADEGIIKLMEAYDSASKVRDNTNKDTIDTNQASTVESIDNTATTAEAAREKLRLGIVQETGSQITKIEDYISAVEQGSINASDEIINLIEQYEQASGAKGRARQLELQAEDKELRKSIELNTKQDSYNQEYWAARLKQLKDNPETADQAQSILKGEMDVLKDKTYSGDKIITVDDQNLQRENLMAINSQLGVLGASPAAPPEYIFEMTLNNIDKWIEEGNGSVKETVSGMFDENTTKVYTLDSGDVITRKMTSPVITDEDGEEYRFGDDVDQLFMNGVEMGTKEGDITTTTKDGEANHVDSTTGIGDDNNPNSPANFSAEGNGNGNGQSGNNAGQSGEETPAETDPVVGEDIPLPNDLTDPNGAGAYGQDGQAFSLDGVTFWKRIKDRNGRWTYTRMDSFENQGTTARRQDWGQNVQNF